MNANKKTDLWLKVGLAFVVFVGGPLMAVLLRDSVYLSVVRQAHPQVGFCRAWVITPRPPCGEAEVMVKFALTGDKTMRKACVDRARGTVRDL